MADRLWIVDGQRAEFREDFEIVTYFFGAFMRCVARWLASVLAVISFATTAQATTYVVNVNLADPASGTAANCSVGNAGTCTLRDAIAAAVGGDTIVFAPSVTRVIVASRLDLNFTANTNPITIDGGGTVAIDGNLRSGVFMTEIATFTVIRGLTIQNGGSVAQGAGVLNKGFLTLTDSSVVGNDSDDGGGMYNLGTATLTNTTFSANSALDTGGGITNLYTLTLTNSTLSGNSAAVRSGGGIYNGGGGTTTIVNSTLSGNTDDIATSDSPAIIVNSIIADGCYGLPRDGGGNLDGGTSCGFTAASSQSNATLNLAPLANNGGPTLTILPGAGSAAIDFVACSNGPAPSIDQRGVTRPQGSKCDSGAVEVEQYALTMSVTGGGRVSASPIPYSGAIESCTATCTGIYLEGTTVTLTATPVSGSSLSWSGDCSALAGAPMQATADMSQSLSCTATYTPIARPVASAPLLERWAIWLLLSLVAACGAGWRWGRT